jgi:hypothetical protein
MIPHVREKFNQVFLVGLVSSNEKGQMLNMGQACLPPTHKISQLLIEVLCLRGDAVPFFQESRLRK